MLHVHQEAGQRARNLAILVEDSPAFEALGLSDEPALVLGMAELRLFRRVAIDFKAQRILFDLPADRTGVSFFNLTPRNTIAVSTAVNRNPTNTAAAGSLLDAS